MSGDESYQKDSEETGEENGTIRGDEEPEDTFHSQLSKGSGGEKRVDAKLLDECPVLSDYEKKLLVLSYIEKKGPTEIGRILGKDKSTIVPQRDRAYNKYVRWLETRMDEDNVKINKALRCLTTQDSKINKIQLAIQDMEARMDRAKALLEAREKMKLVTKGALEHEAILNPRRTPAYIKEAITKSNLKSDRFLAGKYEIEALLERLTPQESWKCAVEDFGKTFDEWRAENGEDPERESELTFKEYVQRVLWHWIFSNRAFDCRCPECREIPTIHEYGENKWGQITCFSEQCSSKGKSFFYLCPLCKKLDFEDNRMVYLPKKGIFSCKICGLEMKPKQKLEDT